MSDQYGGYPPPPPIAPPPYLPHGQLPPPRRRSRLPVVLAILAALVLLSGAIAVPLVLAARDSDEASAEKADEPVDTTLDKVAVYDGLEFDHVPQGTEVDYPQSPPVGGRHLSQWLECGAYDEELPEMNVVHDLEHGTVWITYRPDDVDADAVRDLEDALPDNGILSPYAGQDAPVVVTVWGAQLELTGADDPRLGLFVEEYGDGHTAREPQVTCHGGVDPADLPDPSGTAA